MKFRWSKNDVRIITAHVTCTTIFENLYSRTLYGQQYLQWQFTECKTYLDSKTDWKKPKISDCSIMDSQLPREFSLIRPVKHTQRFPIQVRVKPRDHTKDNRQLIKYCISIMTSHSKNRSVYWNTLRNK